MSAPLKSATPKTAWAGQSWPRTASGRSSLVEPLPHHISCDALHVTFRADPDRVAHFLPPGLTPLETGEGWVMVAEMAKASAADPGQIWRDPARSSYNECVLGFYCRFGEKIGRYSALVWVDRDWSLGMGAIFGWGKRLGAIDRSRRQLSNPLFASEDYDLGGAVSRYGHRVLSLSIAFPGGGTPIEALPGPGGSKPSSLFRPANGIRRQRATWFIAARQGKLKRSAALKAGAGVPINPMERIRARPNMP